MADNPRTTPGFKIALSIAGSDSSGGAGIQADLKTFAVMGVYGATAITAITAQNTTGVKEVDLLEADLVAKQIDAVAGDIEVDAVKTGMLGSSAIIEAVAKSLNRSNLFPLVVDPVMVSRAGDSLIDDDAVTTLAKKIIPLAAVITPNGQEAARLLGQSGEITDVTQAGSAAATLCKKFGARACIVTGIKRMNGAEPEAVDVFYDGEQTLELTSEWFDTPNTHGAGCTFSAAITAGLATGKPLNEAVEQAKQVISEAIRQQATIGAGNSPVNHLAWAKVK